MNKEWYSIDVKANVLIDLQNYLSSKHIDEKVLKKFEMLNVREMMDMETVSAIDEIIDKKEFVDFVMEKYMYYRTLKYGQVVFWESASCERAIGYNGRWYQFVENMLKQYCEMNDDVLFVGTADGREIPDSKDFNFYALEQIGASAEKISTNKVEAVYEGDFEDSTLIIKNGNSMQAIVALRCLMPNTRIDKFMRFVENNIRYQGVVILSHPMGYIDKEGNFGPLPNCDKTRMEFEKRLKTVLSDMGYYWIVDMIETAVEYFYVLKRGK